MGFRGRYKNRRDPNELEIVDAFRKHGATVARLDEPADLLVGYKGCSHLVEIKQKGKGLAKHQRDLNDRQQEFADEWRGDLTVVRSVDDAMACLSDWSGGLVVVEVTTAEAGK